MADDKMTSEQYIRLECAKTCLVTGTKMSFDKDACISAAKKMYNFVMEQPNPSGSKPKSKSN